MSREAPGRAPPARPVAAPAGSADLAAPGGGRDAPLAPPALGRPPGPSPRPRTSRAVMLLLVLGLVVTVGPLCWMLLGAFSDPVALDRLLNWVGSGDFLSKPAPIAHLGDLFTLQHLQTLLADGRLARWAFNSFLVAGAITFGQLLINALAAFAFSVGSFRGRELLFWLVLMTMMVPGQIVMLPLYLMMGRLHLLDSLWAVILPALASPYGIFLVRQYMQGIPRELAESARCDGASDLELFMHVYLPLSRPILATSGIFVFISQWNSFLWPLVVLNSESAYTLTVGLATMQEQQNLDYGLLMAGATLAALPMVAVFLFFSRHLLEGLRAGAVKG